eukprot:3100011-Alexandrium_andersonii.AAC.1
MPPPWPVAPAPALPQEEGHHEHRARLGGEGLQNHLRSTCLYMQFRSHCKPRDNHARHRPLLAHTPHAHRHIHCATHA